MYTKDEKNYKSQYYSAIFTEDLKGNKFTFLF